MKQQPPEPSVWFPEPVLTKHNLRMESKDGWTVEVWTGGRLVLGRGPSVGVRVSEGKRKRQVAPNVSAVMTLVAKNPEAKVREVTVAVDLKKIIIEGGYHELIYLNGGAVGESRPPFTGRKGTWEALLEDPFKIVEKEGHLPGGEYLLKVRILIDGGPEFTFANLPMQCRRTRSPGPPEEVPSR